MHETPTGIPRLRMDFDQPEDDVATIGFPKLLFDGQPFPYATVGGFRLEGGDNEFLTITLSIPVKLESAA